MAGESSKMTLAGVDDQLMVLMGDNSVSLGGVCLHSVEVNHQLEAPGYYDESSGDLVHYRPEWQSVDVTLGLKATSAISIDSKAIRRQLMQQAEKLTIRELLTVVDHKLKRRQIEG